MELLQNERVILEPIDQKHIEGLYRAGQAKEIWTHLLVELTSLEAVERYVQNAVAGREAGTDFPFVVIDAVTKEILGATWYMDISHKHKRLEIGSTWLTPKAWRTDINTNCKYLLLKYGFEVMQFNRLQIKTGHENYQSQKAIERIGAVKEGILRNHMIRKEGILRHTVMYSFILEDWPETKTRFLTEFQVSDSLVKLS